jgi:hypothetical protein
LSQGRSEEDLRKLGSDELYSLQFSPDQFKEDVMGRACGTYRNEDTNIPRVLFNIFNVSNP